MIMQNQTALSFMKTAISHWGLDWIVIFVVRSHLVRASLK
jgi:hypothetical protein